MGGGEAPVLERGAAAVEGVGLAMASNEEAMGLELPKTDGYNEWELVSGTLFDGEQQAEALRMLTWQCPPLEGTTTSSLLERGQVAEMQAKPEVAVAAQAAPAPPLEPKVAVATQASPVIPLELVVSLAEQSAPAPPTELQAALAKLSRLSARRQRPLVALLVGPAGSGKSTLARALCGALSSSVMGSGQDLALLPSSHAHTRPHGMAFVEALTVGTPSSPPSLVLLDTPGVLPAAPSNHHPTFQDAASGSSPAPAPPLPDPELVGWQQAEAQRLLVQWLQNGTAHGSAVLLEPSPPLRHLVSLEVQPYSKARKGTHPLHPDCAVLVLSAEDILCRLGCRPPPPSGAAAAGAAAAAPDTAVLEAARLQHGTKSIEDLLGVILLWARGSFPLVVLTRMESLPSEEQQQVRGYVSQKLCPGGPVLELAPGDTSASSTAFNDAILADVISKVLLSIEARPSNSLVGPTAEQMNSSATNAPQVGRSRPLVFPQNAKHPGLHAHASEPERGIHATRCHNMLDLLWGDMVMDASHTHLFMAAVLMAALGVLLFWLSFATQEPSHHRLGYYYRTKW